MAAKKPTTPAAPPPPVWLTRMLESYQAGEAHAFILHGDVDGIAMQALTQRAVLAAALNARREAVATYHLASGGIQIANPTQPIWINPALPGEFAPERRPGWRETTRRQRALDLAGAGASAPAPAANRFAAALAAGGLGAGGADADALTSARTPAQALALLDTMLRSRGTVGVVLDYADTLIPPAPMAGKGALTPDDRRVLVQVLAWAKDPAISEAGHPIVLLVRDLAELHPDLRASGSGFKVIPLALPDRTARIAYLDWYLAARQARGEPIATEVTIAELATLTAGLNLRQIEDMLLVAAQAPGGVTRPLVKSVKDQVIASEQTDIAEMIDPLAGGFGVIGGMARLKAWAQDAVIAPVRAGRIADVPKGVLLVGPPGTGKTFFVRALAAEVGFNAVALQPNRILGGIVGESERKLARFFSFVKALAPTLVFVDEIDQSDMSRRGNGSGNPVAANLFNAMLQFMSDETLRGQVVVVFASNRPDLLDSALLRFGRMDAIIPVLLPDAEERAAILTAQARLQGATLPDAARQALVSGTNAWSAADLGGLIRKARSLAQRRGGGATISVADATQALRLIRPATLAQAEYYTLLAVQACNDAEHLPPAYADLLINPPALQAALADAADNAGLGEDGPMRRARR